MSLEKPQRVDEKTTEMIGLLRDAVSLYDKLYPLGYEVQSRGMQERTSGGNPSSDPTAAAFEAGEKIREGLEGFLKTLREGHSNFLGAYRQMARLSPPGTFDHMRETRAGEQVSKADMRKLELAQSRRRDRGEE